MNKYEIIKNLVECKAKTDSDVSKLRLDEICETAEDLPDETVKGMKELNKFLEKYIEGTASPHLDDIDKDILIVYEKIKEIRRRKDSIKRITVQEMRQVKKKRAIIVIAILSAVMGAVIALGIMSAFGIISSVWCNLIGVLDTAFGIMFFIYEYCDDKFQESSIMSGDFDTIKKFSKGKTKTGDIINSGAGSINITGKVKGNISTGISEETLKELFKL